MVLYDIEVLVERKCHGTYCRNGFGYRVRNYSWDWSNHSIGYEQELYELVYKEDC